MRKILIFMITLSMSVIAYSQEYIISSAGIGKSGNYNIKVVVSTKKKPKSNLEDLVMRYAVHGVLFRGIMSTDGYGEHKPLIENPGIEQSRSDFFKPFFEEGQYKKYASIVETTLSTMKNKQTKRVETSANVLVDKETLLKDLEKAGVVKGFSNLW
ncbi:MAG: hypothetical protein IJ328_06585 [Muribaculaceae bacterium]|nr:hypothetical protein [Muribaculaceae bacterium]